MSEHKNVSFPETVWKLEHFKVAEDVDERDDPRLIMESFAIGLYSSKANAESAVQRLLEKSGFRDYPGGFRMMEYFVDQDVYSQGFLEDE